MNEKFGMWVTIALVLIIVLLGIENLVGTENLLPFLVGYTASAFAGSIVQLFKDKE